MVHQMNNQKIAVILVRGLVSVDINIKKTLELLRLQQKHVCVVLDNTPENLGMAKKVKDYVTYGLIDETFYTTMLEKRSLVVGKADVKINAASIAKEYFTGEVKLRDFETKFTIKPFFRLHPPIGGFERGGIKAPFSMKGVLGDRGDKISALITKML
jgi:large subunit ribosomal protein L30